jgi:hypothetical protein
MKDYTGDVVTTFAEMEWWRDRFLGEDGPQFLVVIGTPGTGKSRMFSDNKPPHTLYLGGALSAFHFYTQLYIHLNDLVIIDDVDSLFKDKAAVNLLKCLCNTDATRTVYWGKRNKQLDDEGVPTRFETTSRVCILANTLTSIEANLAAVLDRAFVIEFKPNADELHSEVGGWFMEDEVYDFVGKHLNLVSQPSMRFYVRAQKMKEMGGDWQAWLLRQWLGDDPKLALLGQVLADRTLVTAEQRVARFAELGGGSRATYMRKQAEWRQLSGSPSRSVA